MSDNREMIVLNGEQIDELVRCKDCKFYKQLDDTCPYLGEDGYYKELPGEDDYCSRGERESVFYSIENDGTYSAGDGDEIQEPEDKDC